jgi:transcriptional regulator of acetoin/glycerol metabolism
MDGSPTSFEYAAVRASPATHAVVESQNAIIAAATDAVSASWRRCIHQHRLDPDGRDLPRVITQAALNDLRECVEGVLTLSREELDRLHTLVRTIGYATIFAEPTGVIIELRCQDADAERFSEHGARPGAVWSEHLEGTNGIGTCIVEQQPVSVHREQHFRRRHADLSCSGAPIFGADGRLTAVLNVSSCATEVSDRSHALALAVATDWARAIEERQFRERFRREWNLALARSHGDSDGPAVLLAVDSDHTIVGADRNARTVFGLDDGRLRKGVDLWAVFNRNPSHLRRKGTDDVATRLTRIGRTELWHGLVTSPEIIRGWRNSPDARLHTRPRIGLLAGIREPAPVEAPRGGLSPGALRRVREHIESHLDKNISLDALAATAGLSVHHFARAFKQTAGVSPHRYLLQQRIDRAANLIGTTDLPLSQIALTVGFADQSHFCKHFSRLTGSTPSDFRRVRR